MKKPISALDFLIAASCSGSAKALATRLGIPLHIVHIKLLVLKRKGIEVVFDNPYDIHIEWKPGQAERLRQERTR